MIPVPDASTGRSVAVGSPDTNEPVELSVGAAYGKILSMATPLPRIESVPLALALDRVLAKDVVSPIDVPGHDNSAMDGFAFCASSVGVAGTAVLPVAGAALAGHAYPSTVPAGQCVRIMTGAVMPAGCDTVIAQELVTETPGGIQFSLPIVPGQHRRMRGEDVARGDIATLRGARLGPAQLGLIASLGVSEVDVYERLRVAYFSSGDELREPGQPLSPGAIFDSNGPAMLAMLKRLGIEPISLGVVPDDAVHLSEALKTAAATAEVVISTGGVSVGEADFTRTAMQAFGEVHFWRVAIKPGRPIAFGRIEHAGQSAIFFGLPGNPVAAMVTFYVLVRDALLKWSGAHADELSVPRARARTDSVLRKHPGRTEYPRGFIYRDAESWRVRPVAQQGSGILRSMSDANCLIELPQACADVEKDGWVDVIAFDGLA